MKLVITSVLAGAAALCCPVLVAQPAAALSCAGWPDDVALQAARGRLPDAFGSGPGRPFTDAYDYAVLGTVRSLGRSGLHGGTEVVVDVDVDVAFFLPGVRDTVTLSMTDGGAMVGYPFTPGRSYFIPVRTTQDVPGSRPLINYVMVCDPVREVGPGESARLVAAAGQAGVAVSRPGPAPSVGSPSVGAPSSRRSGPWSAIGAWSVIAAGAVAAGSTAATRLRRRG